MRKAIALLVCLAFLTASYIIMAKPAFASTDATENTWVPKAPMHVARSNLGVAVVDGKIYAIGGLIDNGAVTGTNEEYNPETDMWTYRKPMPTPRSDFAVVVHCGKIYCIGGSNDGVNEVYDPATDTWETRASIPTPRTSFSTVVYNDKIYVIGGTRGPAYLGVTEAYDPASDKWEKMASMPNVSSPETSVVINGEIYLISGSRSSSSYIESISYTAAYDEDTDSWTSKASMPVVKHGAGLVFDDKIYFVGGSYEYSSGSPVYVTLLQIYDPTTDTWSKGAGPPAEGAGSMFLTSGEMAPKRIYVVLDPLRIYDPEKDVWVLGPSKPVNRGGMGIAVLDDKIYAIGGFTSVFLGFDRPAEFTITRYATNEVYTPVGYGTVPPTIKVVSPVTQTYNESSVSLVFTVDRQANWTGYSVDGGETVTTAGNATLEGLANGSHNVTVYAKDAFNNTGASETVYFTVEVPFPTTLAVAPVVSMVVVGVLLAIYVKRRQSLSRDGASTS